MIDNKLISGKLLYSSIFVLLLVVSVILYRTSYVKFQPLLFDNGYKAVEMSKYSYQQLEAVLKFYHVKYKIENGEMYVRRSLALDEEMVSNYTAKALDEKWISEHLK